MDNTITVVEIKRRGMTAIEEALRRGPVHLIKRNRPAAVILSEQQYQWILHQQVTGTAPAESAIAWLLAHPLSQQSCRIFYPSTRGSKGGIQCIATTAGVP